VGIQQELDDCKHEKSALQRERDSARQELAELQIKHEAILHELQASDVGKLTVLERSGVFRAANVLGLAVLCVCVAARACVSPIAIGECVVAAGHGT
jgi:hypothetical protein